MSLFRIAPALIVGFVMTSSLAGSPSAVASEDEVVRRLTGLRALSGDAFVGVSNDRRKLQVKLTGILAPRACYAHRARAALHAQIAGERLVLRASANTRTSAYVQRGRVDVAGVLLSRGFVRVDRRRQFQRRSRYLALERRAKSHGRGLWKNCASRPTANLVLTLSDSADPIQVGSDLTYIVRVVNRGPRTGSRVKISVDLPKSLDPSRRGMEISVPGQCMLSTATWDVECSINGLARLGIVEVKITVRPNSAGQLRASGSVASSTSDPARGDNASAEETTVVA